MFTAHIEDMFKTCLIIALLLGRSDGFQKSNWSPSDLIVKPENALTTFSSASPSSSASNENIASIEDDFFELSGNRIKRLGVGTWAWGDQLFWGYNSSMDESLQAAYDESIAQGVTLFDTAELYGFGRSELLLSRFSRQNKDKIKPYMATKFAPYPFRFHESSVLEACTSSMDRLGVDQIDLYQIHWPMFFDEKYWKGLAECYHKGYVKSVGVSNYGPNQLKACHKALSDLGVPLSSNQIQYSLLCRQQENNGALAMAKSLGVVTLAYSPLAQGILTDKFSEADMGKDSRKGPRSSGWRAGGDLAITLPKVRGLLSVMREISAAREKTPAQIALNWCICKGTVPIPGARNAKQAKDNAGSLGWRLTGDEMYKLDVAARASGVNLPLQLQRN